ncbi:efflux RND transporter periplasmic adaptor subunit [Pseudomonas sp. M30-35]|uniref:efflux RND transporter periplasmic adaptor subunit n=1 Tax=Pseudomonas sp. M30-35 TaxID=1981174 RepID=UPI000B3BE128|nr:efflux RND transporter periplasmic adaptor subunit [Pseudomonas sp. M30-35]ARU90287.1 efflux transporter periplasmic adaptor subunit [Pseudomonas sp. M30-35]
MRFQQGQWRAVWLGLVLLVLVGCDPAQPIEGSAPPAQVSVMILEPIELRVNEDLSGRVAAVRTAEIRAQIGGIVQQRLFDQGAEVKAGAALFQINPAPFKAEADSAAATLQRAVAVLARARIRADRLEPLMKAEAVSRQVYDDAISLRDQAAADVAQAKATLARRQLDLQFATVEAPISGRIDQALVSEGALVSPSDSSPLARIQQINQVYVDVRQSTASLESLRQALANQVQPSGPGLVADVLSSDGKPSGLTGRILFSGIDVDAGTGDVLLRILVDNPQRQLLPGMYVQARIPRAHYPKALTVPQQAVIRTGGQASVWVVDDHNLAKRVAIELGELVDRRYRIASGLSAGQQVVIEGGERLAEDAQVTAHIWQPTATTEHLSSATH